jgi:hypothetical protein
MLAGSSPCFDHPITGQSQGETTVLPKTLKAEPCRIFLKANRYSR